MTTVPRLQYSAKAEAYFTTVSGVRLLPTIPRIPEILTIKDIADSSPLYDANVRNEASRSKESLETSLGISVA